MVLNIGTWNLCLGLFHKKDYVRNLLYENDIDILNLQETELEPDIDLNNLNIKGYVLEVETNENKKRIATYIKTSVQYKRRNDLEKPNLHLIILDIQANPPMRVITLYRTFRPQDASSPREHFKNQLNLINEATTNNTVLLGDMNLDENKRYAVNYGQRSLFQDFDEIIGHHQYTQHVTETTWERVIENRVKSSVIDHIYSTNSTSVEKVTYKDTSYGDHRLILMRTSDVAKIERSVIRRRSWRKYSSELLVEELRKVKWQTEIENIQELWNSFEQEITTVVDKIAPLEEINTFINRGKNSAILKRKQNRRGYLLQKRKRTALSDQEKNEVTHLNKYINNFYYEDRKQHVRKKIIPGNNKSLWDAVRIAKDIEPTPLPTTVTKEGISYSGRDVPSAFSSYFKSKIENLEESLSTFRGVYNGCKFINSEERNFMTEEKVGECLNELKIKNCEGYDRIPMRILKDGASVLKSPLSSLFSRIYKKKEIPEQWKVAKVIPLHKKGNKQDVANYRPISNLCSISKVFEKLIQKRLEEIGEENNIDITGEQQHGFKKNRSTITAALTIQSIISREMDENNYVVMSSLDLSAAFDLVNLDLLLTRLKKMGLPSDIILLLEIWLRNRFFYVEANGLNSMVLNSDIGTVQGSILGPILYALFIRPLYDLEKLTTFADDNYVIGYHKEKHLALRELGEKLVRIVKWLKDSGLKVNEKKTELCVFH